MLTRRSLLVFPLFFLTALISGNLHAEPRPPKPGPLFNYFIGNAERPANQPLGGPAIALIGGGLDVNRLFERDVRPIVNGGDVVVLRTDFSDGYQNYFITRFRSTSLPGVTSPPANSIETLVVNTRNLANSDYVRWVVEGANFIFIAGGDQSDYLARWADTELARAIERAYARGAVIGGTSAGAQVLGEFVYDPQNNAAVTSAEAVANPYRASMRIADRFVDLPLLHNTTIDVHFYDRRRMGRLLAFMARLREDARTSEIIGIAMDDDTSFFINKDGFATVRRQAGNIRVAFVLTENRLETSRERVAPAQSLIYRNLGIVQMEEGDYYDFRSMRSNQPRNPISINGAVPPDIFYDPNRLQ